MKNTLLNLLDQPVLFNDNENINIKPESKKSSVLVLLCGEDIRKLTVLMTHRPDYMRVNPDDMCFPGGGQDVGETIIETAMREAQEEIDLNDKNIEIIGDLGEKVTRETGYRLTPIIAWLPYEPSVRIKSVYEVDDIMFIELKKLYAYRYSAELSNGLRAPQFNYNNRIFKGVSAEILNYLIEKLYDEPKFS